MAKFPGGEISGYLKVVRVNARCIAVRTQLDTIYATVVRKFANIYH